MANETIDKIGIEIESDASKSSSGIDELTQRLKKLSNTVRTTIKNLSKLKETLGDIKGLDTLPNVPDTPTMNNRSTNNDKSGANQSDIPSKSAMFNKGLNGTINILKNVGKTGVGVFGSLLKHADKTINGIIKGFKRMLKPLAQTTLALVGVRGAFTGIRKALSAYLSYDNTLSEQLQNNWAVLGSLISPVLEKVIGLFTTLVAYINGFVKALFGIDLVARANAKALNNQAKSTKKAANELGNLAKFDDLNVVEFDKDSGSNFTPLTVDSIDTKPIEDFVKFLKGKDWYGIGMEVARKINEGLASINFDIFVEKSRQVGTNLSDFLNGLTDGFEHATDLIGRSLGKIINGITGFVSEVVKKTHWDKVGKNIGNALNSAIDEINWDDVGVLLTAKFRILILTLGNIITTLDWSSVGSAIYKMLRSAILNIPWSELPTYFFAGITGIFKAISGFFTSNRNWQETGEKLRNGIIEAFKNIQWSEVYETVKTGISDAFKGLGDFLVGLFNIDVDALKTVGKTLFIVSIGLLALSKSIKLNKKSEMEEVSEGVKKIGNGLENLSKAAGVIAILGGVALVLHELTDLLSSFAVSQLSVSEAAGLFTSALGMIAVAFIGIATATKLLDWKAIVGAAVVLGGLSLALNQLNGILKTIAKTGMSVGDVTSMINSLMVMLIALVATFTAAAFVLSSNPLALVGLLALTTAISAILIIVKNTLPTILDVLAKFINNVAPPLIQIFDTIGKHITNIIYALGKTLPPIIISVGSLFDRIFNGIAKVVRTVGDVIVNIMTTAKSLITDVLDKLLWFVNNIGGAVENSVNHIINAVTKLINFVVSGMEWLINTAIVKSINSLIRKVNRNAIAEKLGWQLGELGTVSIDRFRPKLATGTNRIEAEGLYHLHKDEAVVPKRYNPAVNNRQYEESNNRIIEKLDRFMNIVENMETTNVFAVDGEPLYKKTDRYIKKQENIYGTTV